MFSTDQRKFYDENGYILISNIFDTAEIEECSEEYDKLFRLKNEEKYNMEATWEGDWNKEKEEGNPIEAKVSVQSIHNLQCHSAIFTKMLINSKLLDAVSCAIGSENILLHHTKAHVKPKGNGAPFPTHQDYHYFPFKNHSMVAVFINLDDSNSENGGLVVFPGSHKLGPLENKSNVPTHFYVDQTEFSLDQGVTVNARKGDVLIFSYLLVHGSFPNNSERNRRMFLIQLMAAEDEPSKLIHLSPCHGMVLRGRNVKQDADIANRHSK